MCPSASTFPCCYVCGIVCIADSITFFSVHNIVHTHPFRCVVPGCKFPGGRYQKDLDSHMQEIHDTIINFGFESFFAEAPTETREATPFGTIGDCPSLSTTNSLAQRSSSVETSAPRQFGILGQYENHADMTNLGRVDALGPPSQDYPMVFLLSSYSSTRSFCYAVRSQLLKFCFPAGSTSLVEPSAWQASTDLP